MNETGFTTNGRRRLWRAGFIATALTVVALGSAGCAGNNNPDVTVATAPSGGTAASPIPAASGGGNPVAYAQCMRRNGVPNFPDPAKDGGIKFGSNSNVDPNSAEFKNANEKCKQYMPAGEKNVNPGQDPWSADLKVKYANCMRQNGEPSFPDPDKDGMFPQLQKGGPVDPDTDQFKKADAACSQYKPQNMPTNRVGGGS